ncbi:MAG: hypothetical protein ACI8Y7_000188 [Candidatus Woesearchaeota archaeon]|jgi:hypothetical protein
MDPKVIDYIRDCRLKSFTDDQIKAALIKTGHNDIDLAHYFMLASQQGAHSPVSIPKTQDPIQTKPTDKSLKQPIHPKKNKLLRDILIMLLILVFIGLTYYFIFVAKIFS